MSIPALDVTWSADGRLGVECLAAAYRRACQLGVDMRVVSPANGAGRVLHLTDPGDPLLS